MRNPTVWICFVAIAGALGGACGGRPQQNGTSEVCCNGQVTSGPDFGTGATCICQFPGTLPIAPGVSSTLTVSGTACTVNWTFDAGTDTVTGTVSADCSQPTTPDGPAADGSAEIVEAGSDADTVLDAGSSEGSEGSDDGGGTCDDACVCVRVHLTGQNACAGPTCSFSGPDAGQCPAGTSCQTVTRYGVGFNESWDACVAN